MSKHLPRAGNGLVGRGRAIRTSAPATEAEVVRQMMARLDPVPLGVALAAVCGSMLLLATSVLVLRDGQHIGSHLVLLSQYLPGYRVTSTGSVIGALYAGAGGFLFGWLAAHLRNILLSICLWLVRFWANLSNTYFLDRFD